MPCKNVIESVASLSEEDEAKSHKTPKLEPMCGNAQTASTAWRKLTPLTDLGQRLSNRRFLTIPGDKASRPSEETVGHQSLFCKCPIPACP
jgi:hypothetical protein